MFKYRIYVCLFLIFLFFYDLHCLANATVYQRIFLRTMSGSFPVIDQIVDTKPFLINGSLASSPAACVMIAAYYGSINKRTDDLSPSGYGSYLCKPYEMKRYLFEETTLDADENQVAGAFGYLVKNKNCDPPPELPITFLRAHSILSTFYPFKVNDEKIIDLIHREIQKNHPIYMQFQNHNVVIVGYGSSLFEKDLLFIKDPSNQKRTCIYLNQIKPNYFIFTTSLSFGDTVKVSIEELELYEKPTSTSLLQTIKKKNTVGVIKMHSDFYDLWINELVDGVLQTWFYIQWEDGTKGWSKLGKYLTNYFEPYVKPIEDPEREIATVTITIHEEKVSGPVLKGAMVYATDGKGKTYSQSSNNFGIVTIKGNVGKWSFKITKTDFYDKNWKENIEGNFSKDVFILKKPKKEEDKTKPNLVCKEIRLKPGKAEEGKEYYINPAIINIGKADVTVRTHVKVLLSPRNDTNLKDDYILGEAEVSVLKIQETCIATLHFYQLPMLPFNLGKEYQVWPIIIVDSQNELTESDENNTFKSNSSITIKRKPREGDKSPCNCPPIHTPELISPIRIKVDGTRVTFKWKEVECASFYDISIFTEDGDLLYYDGPISGTVFTIEFPLESKSRFYWSITPGNQHDWGPSSTRSYFDTK